MSRRNKVLEAVVLASLMAIPGMAGAEAWYAVGPVSVDGGEASKTVVVSNPTAPYQVGKAGSAVEVGDFGLKDRTDRYSALAVLSPSEVVFTGRTISTKALEAEGGAKIVVGDADTESVTIAGDENTTGLGSLRFDGEAGGTSITVTAKNIDVSTAGSGDGVSAIWGQNGTQSETAPEGAASVTLKGDTIHIQSPGTAIVAYSNSQININGDTTVDAGDYAVDARGNSTVNINTDGAHSTVVNGDIVFETPNTKGDGSGSGNIINANVNLNLTGKDSVWTGRSYEMYTPEGGTEETEKYYGDDYYGHVTGLKLTMKDGATWNATGNNIMNELDAEDSTINVQEGTEYVHVGTATLTGTTANIDADDSDVYVDTMKATDSTFNLNGTNVRLSVDKLSGSKDVINTGSLDNKVLVGEKDAEDLTVHGTGAIADAIRKDGANAQKLADVAALKSDPGTSVADKVSTDEGTVAGRYEADVKDGKVTNVRYEQNRTNLAVSNMAVANLVLWRQENNDMNKRLGELRDSEGQQGVWARMVRGEAKYGQAGLKNQYNYYQVGYDTKLSTNSRWTVGAAFNKTDGTTTFQGGTSDNDHHGVALYGSYLGDKGGFVDLIAKYSNLDIDYNVTGGAGSGDYDMDAYSLSAEVGKRFHGSHGFWIEPQAELTYGSVNSVDYTTDNDVHVHQDSMDSFVGRLGFSLGKDIKKGHVYARASYLYDFDGDTDVTMTDTQGVSDSYKHDIGGSWWEIGIGTNLNLSKATHMYMDLEKTYGGDVTTPWQWGLGLRYSF